MNNQIKSIQVFGSDCPSCKKLHELTKEAISELNLDIDVEYISDIQRIIDLGLLSAPILMINDKVITAGELPRVEEI
ncbi:MAG TPA: thioredoxin family protein [Patescibacteria group bacterium]|nr:thioredoxin family protein [Patescibacteria group bacterium]